MNFMDHATINTCEVCGKTTLCVSICGAYGPISYSICQDCLIQGKEPYNLIVDYISLAGRYPQDINKIYREAVKEQLILHEKTEEEFSRDVDAAIKEMDSWMTERKQ